MTHELTKASPNLTLGVLGNLKAWGILDVKLTRNKRHASLARPGKFYEFFLTREGVLALAEEIRLLAEEMKE